MSCFILHLFFLFQWEFYSQDKNHNDILDEDEIESMIDRDEDCMVGFIKSCDYDHQKGISIKEWNTCFPPVAAGEYKKAKDGKIWIFSDEFFSGFPVQFLLVNHKTQQTLTVNGCMASRVFKNCKYQHY